MKILKIIIKIINTFSIFNLLYIILIYKLFCKIYLLTIKYYKNSSCK